MSTTSPAVNYWPDSACARAFWTQRDLPPYRRLLADTADWLEVSPGQRWLDLGCGSGQLTRTVWEKSGGTLAEVVALDCAAQNERAIARVRETAQPIAHEHQLRFVHANFSDGLAAFPPESFDGAVSGLAIQYAESWDEERGCWTSAAYDRLLEDVCRVLRPGGTFVFSVNTPNPLWAKIAFTAIHGFFCTRRPLVYFKNSMRMLKYGAWLKREARKGRFHYLPWTKVAEKLVNAGFSGIEHRLSFAGQAWVFRCRRPA